MEHRPVHLHSMLVHGVIAFAPLAAGCYLLAPSATPVLGVGPEVWRFLLWFSLLAMLALSLPSIATGLTERNHMYANWPRSHRAKLLLSVVLVVMVTAEIIGMARMDGPGAMGSALGLAIVIGNCIAVFFLSYFGLRITLGRQSLAPTSYRPDMDFDPPMDIVDCVAEFAAEDPKLIDVRQEHAT